MTVIGPAAGRLPGMGRAVVPSRARRHPRRSRLADRGGVLLETAIAIPVLIAVAVALAWALSLAATTIALGDAARQAARDLARGVVLADALAGAQRAVPGAVVRVEDQGDAVLVVVEEEVSAPVPLLQGISVPLRQSIAIPREWT